MAEFIRQREVKLIPRYVLRFMRVGELNWGWSFDCDADGVVDETQLAPAGKASLAGCRAGSVDGIAVERGRLDHWTERQVTPALIRCGDHTHELTNNNGMGDSRCSCGRWYNSCGQALVDPEHWGEETGETFDDSGHFVHGDYHDYGPEGA